MKIEKILEVLKQNYLCNHCLGRLIANLLSGLTNEERGKILRYYLAFLIDSGEKIDIKLSNFYGMKFRNVKIKVEKPERCIVCNNFFEKKIDEIAKKIVKKLKEIEFESFLIGSIPTDEMLRSEEKLWEKIGTEYVETIKSELNRELGKKIEKLMNKKFSRENPDVTIVVNLTNNSIRLQIRSLYIFGRYKKLVRGIPQSKWKCPKCGGKGCVYCKGTGKLYPTSVQEIIEKPLLKVSKAKKSKFSGMGREDIDARCLDYRPFVIELVKPLRRKFKLKELQRQINKSKKVKVKDLKFTNKLLIRKIKTERVDKTYLAEVTFTKPIENKKLKDLKQLVQMPVVQKTPTRVLHRRANKIRRRSVREIKWKVISSRKLQLKIRGESGLYIKELITGDNGRTKPNVAEILNNKVKKIKLDVIKIHTKGVV